MVSLKKSLNNMLQNRIINLVAYFHIAGPRRHRRQGAERVPLALPQGDRVLHGLQGGSGNGE